MMFMIMMFTLQGAKHLQTVIETSNLSDGLPKKRGQVQKKKKKVKHIDGKTKTLPMTSTQRTNKY